MHDQADMQTTETAAAHPTADDIRTEYSAIASYFNTVVQFRFTTLGFFIAAVGFILSGEITKSKAALLLVIAIAMYIIELRNRTLYNNLSDRAIDIERIHWGHSGPSAYRAFFSHMMKTPPANDPQAPPQPGLDYPTIWNRTETIRVPVSHGLGLDLLYSAVALFAIVQLYIAKSW
jgi:hypothetical protein